MKAVICISPDSHTGRSDAAADAFLRDQALRAGRGIRRRVARLGKPPYVAVNAFQHRTRLLADLGAIEHDRRFGQLLREMLVDVFRTYGVAGGLRTLRNINGVQRILLPELESVDLFTRPPRVTVPVHYVCGERDALITASMVEELSAAIAAPDSTVLRVPNAGHMVHFDQPGIVRSMVETA